MRVLSALGLVVLLLAAQTFAVEISASIDSVRILSVSTQVDSDNSARSGSINGGTRLFIKAVGHDANVAANNVITVGPYPCVIPEMGVNEIFITCITTAATDKSQQLNLPVVIKTLQRSDSQCAQQANLCTFSYDGGRTPIVDAIVPRSITASDQVTWWGNFRISNTNQIEKMLVGNLICDRFFKGLNEDSGYDGNNYNSLTCEIPTSHPAGFYQSQFISKPGKAINRSRLSTVRSTTLNTPYEIQISSQQLGNGDKQSISSQGGFVKFSVSGIPSDLQNVSIDWQGQACENISFEQQEIQCRLPAGMSNPTKDNQIRYVSGSGVRLSIYNTGSWDINSLIKDHRTNPSKLSLFENKIIPTTEYCYIDYDDDGKQRPRQFYVFSGYFNPPRDGSYQFQSSSSYYAKVFFQTSGDSTDESTMTLINNIKEGTQFRSPYSSDYGNHVSTSDKIPLNLQKGKAYYFQIYALANDQNNFCHTTGVRIPTNAAQKYINSVGQVSRLNLNYDFTKEVIEISYQDKDISQKNTFKINFIAPFGAKSRSEATQWDLTENFFNRDTQCGPISDHFAYWISSAQNTCIQKDILNSEGKKIGSTWQLTFLSHRNQIQPTFVYDPQTTNSPTYTVIRQPGIRLTGTFRLKVNGEYVQYNKSSDLPFNISDYNLRVGIQSILGISDISSSRKNDFSDGAKWIIDFYGITSPIMIEFVESESRLVAESGKLQMVVENLRDASNQLNYISIENELLTQLSTTSHAQIKINGVLTLASLTSKQLQINVLSDSDVVSYTNFVDDESLNQLTFSGVQFNQPLEKSNIRVLYGGVECQVVSSSNGQIIAKYPYKVGGSNKPDLYYSNNGFALSPAAALLTTPVISSISSSTIFSFGGSDLVITGKYFPTSIDNNLSVTIDGKQAIITSVSNTSITIRTPSQLTLGSVNLIVTYKGVQGNQYQLTVSNNGAMTITSIDRTILSPVEKSLIKVTGTNFGTNKSRLSAFLDKLDNSGNVEIPSKYQVNVAEAADTQVKILLPGGLPGQYRLRIVQVGLGSNNPDGANDKIQYNILLNSFSRQTSSIYGGASLIITGQNFSENLTDNQVMILYGKSDSEFCIINSATATQLECTLPNMSTHLPEKDSSATFSVEIWGKLMATAIINPASNLVPQITFNKSEALQITDISSKTQVFGDEQTINGSNFPTITGSLKVVVIGYENVAITINSVTITQVKYVVPNLPQGNYKLVLRTTNGDSNSLDFNIVNQIRQLSNYQVSASGQELPVTVSGCLKNQNPIFKFKNSKVELLSFNQQSGVALIRLPAVSPGNGVKLLHAQSASVTLDNNGNIPWVTHNTGFTVTASSYTVTSIITNGRDITINGTGLNNVVRAYLQIPNSPLSIQYQSSGISSQTSTQVIISFANAPAGSYNIYLLNSNNAYPSMSNNSVQIDLTQLTVTGVQSSYAGGQLLTITGSGFNTLDSKQNFVNICENVANVVSVNENTLVVSTPIAYTQYSINQYQLPPLKAALTGFTTFGNDPQGNSQYLGDGDLLFYYSSTTTGECAVGFDFGNSRVKLSKFELYPRSQGVTNAAQFVGAKFQASKDNTNWVDLLIIGTDFHLGKNMYLINTLFDTNNQDAKYKDSYTFFRIYDSTGNSKCEIVEMKLFGWKQSKVSEISNTLTCPIQVQVNGSNVKQTNQNVVYKQSQTYILQNVSPNYGSVKGNTKLTLTFDRPIIGAVNVVIDGVTCGSAQVSGSTVTCITGVKSISSDPSFIVTIDGQQTMNNGIIFYYGKLWSDQDTWGQDFQPIDGDLVAVKQGNTLIVDVPYVGILNTVIVEKGTLIFANDMNIHFEAHNIMIMHGNLIIGTESAPVTGKVRITMYGTQEDDQLPTHGNKGISIHNGSLDIHGKKRPVTWSELSETVLSGSKSINVTLKAGLDWTIGDEIVIASTDFNHYHSERRIIKSVLNQNNYVTINFDEPLKYKHISVSEIYKGKTIEMRAEVGLLSRNVIFEGDESSRLKSYGAHLMLHGAFTSARIRYAEFTKTGQPEIIGRYPIHFHMVGDVSGSVVEGNAVHDSFARVLTIHATHYLLVKNNVGYNCAGHNIFLEDGIETNNIIQDNLILGTRQVWSMLQTDITAASYWVTNPLNTVVNNRAAGGDFYGFWYETKSRPDGPSARSDICPQGMPLGQFKGNVAHSYDRFGLRIFVMSNLQNPCQSSRNDKNENPFSDNPSSEILWENFVAYRNNEDGVLAEQVGNMVFDNFSLLDNRKSGFNVLLTNFTDEDVVLRNSIIVGKSLSNYATDGELNGTRGVRTPRTDGFRVQNVHFENFDGKMTVFQSCSQCDNFMKWVQGGKLTKFSGISYKNVSSKKMFWEFSRREIYEDMDGSLTGKGSARWITPSDVHLNQQSDCITTDSENKDWDNAVICSKQVVKIEFSNPVKFEEFKARALYVQPTTSNGVPIGTNINSSFYKSSMLKLMNNDLNFGFVGTFLVGQLFSVQWELSGIDFTHMSVHLSAFHRGQTPEDTIVLRFPYSDYRETFEVGKMIANKNIDFYQNVTLNQEPAPLANLKSRVCVHGEWYNDVTEKAMYLCLNQNGRPQSTKNQILERTDVNALKCKKNCPLPPGKCIKDGVPRRLSNLNSWQNKIEDGKTVNEVNSKELVIPCPWEVIVDQDIITFNKIIVQGTLRIDPSKDINIKAYGIFISGGTIIAEGATPGSPYTKQLNFELLGNRNTETQFIIDDTIEVGNKVIVNTGKFVLIGQPATATVSRLTSSLKPNQNSIIVSSTQGWKVGDRIAIASTQFDATEEEEFTITDIQGNTVSLNKNAQYYHFGANQITLSETWGSYTQNLDLRAQVIHLTRNIKIKGSPVSDNIQWGCRVLNYYWKIVADANGNDLPEEKQLHLRGTLNWDGVEMENCGQADTIRGALDFNKCGTDKEKIMSVVKNSAIHNCPGYCANIQDSDLIKIENTNFYYGHPILLRIFNVKNIAITNNHFVAARKRDYPYKTNGMDKDMNVGLYFYSPQDPTVDGILISNNQVQGSEGACLVLPHTSCSNSNKMSASVGIYGNQAQTCEVGAAFQSTLAGCQWAGKVAVARSIKGFMANPPRPGLIVENLLAAESSTSVILRYGNDAIRNVGRFFNSAVYGVAITDSADAYDDDKKAQLCRNNYGATNLVVTRIGETFPDKDAMGLDVICTTQAFDSALFQENVKYTRFRKTYTHPNHSRCSNNYMMTTIGGASDATAGTYNTNVTCVDCEEEAYFNFESSSTGSIGWKGGCGLFICTGLENVLNVDLTGSLFGGKPTTSISHNSGIALTKCKKQENWNGAYSCEGLDYIQVEWESRGPEFNSKSNAPVFVTALEGKYTNKINMSKEWEWDGDEPMNKRENRFVSTMLINQFYKVAYSGVNPQNIIHRIQPRNVDGEPNVWIGYSVTYQVPMNVEVSIDGGPVIPSEDANQNVDLSKKSTVCGANFYDYKTRTLQFIITGAADCIVNTVVLDTVRIHMKVTLSAKDFFKEDNKISFLSKIAAFLRITDFSRIKIVGSTNQSGRFLQSSNTSTPQFEVVIDITNKYIENAQKDASQVYEDFNQKVDSLKKALETNSVPGLDPNVYSLSSSEIMVSTNNNGGVFGGKTETSVVKESSSSSTDNTLAIVLGIVITLIVLAIAIVAYCSYKRYQQKKKILQVQQAEVDIEEDNKNQKETVKPIALDPQSDLLQERANHSNAPFRD